MKGLPKKTLETLPGKTIGNAGKTNNMGKQAKEFGRPTWGSNPRP